MTPHTTRPVGTPLDEARLRAELGRIEPLARAAPSAVRIARAPGRVNLIGEHTDYNEGFVLPAAIGLETWICFVPTDDRRVELTRADTGERETFELDDPRPRRSWIDYVGGTAWALSERNVPLRGLRGLISTSIPIGSGLSSSAAIELASAWALFAAIPPSLDGMELARACQRAENEYVGVRSGLMDQFASSLGRPGAALLLDCRSLEYGPVPLPDGLALVACDTRSPRGLDASEYNARRAQCERAVGILARKDPSIHALRDASIELLDSMRGTLDDETSRRCEHVVRENERTLAFERALREGDLATVGRLMVESHASLRDLFEVSSPELDALVEIMSSVAGVVGARMTGGGFGGCTVNLVMGDAIERARQAVATRYPEMTGLEAGFYVVEPVAGASLLPN